MGKSSNLSDKLKLEIVRQEIEDFKKLIAGHKKLLEAMAAM